MLRQTITASLFVLSSLLFAENWPVGRYVLPIADVQLTVTLTGESDTELDAQVTWPSSDALGIVAGSTDAPFQLLQPNIARLSFPQTTKTFFQLERRDNQELWLRYEDSANPALNTLGKLLKDETPLLNFSDYSSEQAMNDLPEISVWPNHVAKVLWPYWNFTTKPNFATSRCNDGSLPKLENLCWELRAEWLQEGLNRDYTRMVSRQTYTYGVIFHLTGEPKALTLMNAGVELLLERVQPDGSVATVLENGQSNYQTGQHTSQDLAYAQLGLAMAYYLTGDKELFTAIESIKQHIFTQYKNEHWDMLAWTLIDQNPTDSKQQELVAQLDQLNAYMLLLYPLLASEQQAQWRADINWLVEVLLKQFYLPDQQRFAGQLINDEPNNAGERHNDFGHSVKAFWMIYIAGELLDNSEWQRMAEQGIKNITEQAFRFRQTADDYSTWANQAYSSNSVWWEFAELTQASATLAINNESYLRYLPESYRTWFGQYVDAEQGGVWMYAGGGPKQHLWKSGYHESEFALVAYITSALITDQPVSLFYADSQQQFVPYLFKAVPQHTFDIGLGRKRVLFNR